MNARSYFGFICPACKSSVDIGGVVGGTGDPTCPKCNTNMIPNRSFGGAAASVWCPRCRLGAGLINSSTCPQCGGAWQAMPK